MSGRYGGVMGGRHRARGRRSARGSAKGAAPARRPPVPAHISESVSARAHATATSAPVPATDQDPLGAPLGRGAGKPPKPRRRDEAPTLSLFVWALEREQEGGARESGLVDGRAGDIAGCGGVPRSRPCVRAFVR